MMSLSSTADRIRPVFRLWDLVVLYGIRKSDLETILREYPAGIY